MRRGASGPFVIAPNRIESPRGGLYVAQSAPVLALKGAHPADILKLIFREGLLIVGIGLVVGIAGALAAGKVVASFLTVSARAPLTYVIVTGILPIVALRADSSC